MPIVPAANFNPASLTADDLYIAIQNPPGYISGVPTDVFGLVGTASWGAVNKAQHLGSPFDALQTFGPISAASLTDPYDIATDLAIAFGQASGLNNEGWAVRVTDGNDTAASGPLSGALTSGAETVTLTGSAVSGDSFSVTFTSSVLTGSPITLTIPVVSGDTLTSLAAKLATAVNANAVISAAGLFASSTGVVCSIYQPTTLSPQVTYTRTSGSSATATLGTAAASGTGITLKGIFTGVVGNAIQVQISAGAATNTFNVGIFLPTTGQQELYANIPAAGFWKALASAVTNGISGFQGPSAIVAAGAYNQAVGAPTPGTYAFSGGTDGRAGVVTATLLGSNSVIPPTGLYALQSQNPAVGVVWLVGCTDITISPTLLQFAQVNGCSLLQAMALGTTTAAALAQVSAVAVHDPAFAWTKDWVYFYDPVNAITRLVSPNAYIGGYITTLPPAQSPGNKQVALVVGTERNNPTTGNVPYSESEVGQLASAGVMFIANPIPAGAVFGIRHGQTTSLTRVTQPFEYWRMTCWLARSFQAAMGVFVDQLQSQQPNDPFRNAVKLQLNTFLQGLKGANGTVGQIDDFAVVCTFDASQNAVAGQGVNTPTSVAQHYCYVLVRVRYLSSVRFFILTLQGGTTVVTVGATPGQSPPSN
jgi:hypothetical protein